MDRATTMQILFCTYAKGRLTYLSTMLKMDLHSLFSINVYYLARAKKVLVMAIHLGLVDVVQFRFGGVHAHIHMKFMSVYQLISLLLT